MNFLNGDKVIGQREIRGNYFKQKEEKFRIDVRLSFGGFFVLFFTKTVLRSWNRMPSPWRHSRSSWMGLWAA